MLNKDAFKMHSEICIYTPKVLIWDFKVILIAKKVLILCWSLTLLFCIQNTVDPVHYL